MIPGNYTFTTLAASTSDEAALAPAAGLRLMSYSVRETAAAVATVNLCHGTANSSPIMAAINLAASGCDGQNFFPGGLPCEGGIWVERLSGTSEITICSTIS